MNTSVKTLREKLPTEFQKNLLDAAVKNFGDTSNPLRINNFAYALRELIRHVLHTLAPDNNVLDCSWYKNLTGKPRGITRGQRIQYAVQGGLSEHYVEHDLLIDISDDIKTIVTLANDLSKYTHIDQHTFNVNSVVAQKFYDEAIETSARMFALIDDLRHMIWTKLHNSISDEVRRTLFDHVYDELDCLSTHTSIDDTDMEEFWVTQIDDDHIYIEGHGTVHVHLQYGSDSDVKKDMGASIKDQFPFSFSATSATSSPHSVEMTRKDISIDDSSWYE